MAPQAPCPAHTLPSEAQCPEGFSTLCPTIPAAPTPSDQDQILKTALLSQRWEGTRRPCISTHRAGIPTLGRCPQHGHGHATCVGSPAGSRAVAAILLLPTLSSSSRLLGWQPGTEPPHSSGKAGFPCAPGRQRGGEGKMEPFPLWNCSKSKGELPSPLGCAQGR